MATGCKGFGEAGVKRCEAAGTSDHSNGTDDPRTDSSENERAAMASERFFVLNVVNVSMFHSVRDDFLHSRLAGDATPFENPKKVEGRPVLREHWKPRGLLSVGRSRLGFPDCDTDHLVQLLVCKDQHTREIVDIAGHYDVTAAVSYDGVSGSSLQLPDYQCKRVKSGTNSSMIGVIGFLFRFHEPLTKYKITFCLKAIPSKRREKKRSLKEHTACETICQISVTLETGPMKSSKSDKTKKKATESTVSPASFALSAPSLSKESIVLHKRSWWVFSQLRSYRANSKWKDFEKLASDLLLKFTDADTQIAIKLEQSMKAHLKNQPDRALQLIDEAFNFMSEAKNPQLMAGRGYIYQAVFLRRKGSLGEAEKCLNLAGQNIAACQVSVDSGVVVFGRAEMLMSFIRRIPHRSLKQVNEARCTLEKCIDVCLHVEKENSYLYLYAMKPLFVVVLNLMTILLLDCDSDAGRKRIVCKEFILKAEWCLDALKNKYWSEMKLFDKINFYLASSDLEYRRSNYAEAEECALLAKDKAVEIGLNLEASKAQERLDFMGTITRSHIIDNGPQQSESEGENADISSSGAESDWLTAILN